MSQKQFKEKLFFSGLLFEEVFLFRFP